MRADLPKGIQAAQIAHAAGESSQGLASEGTYAFVLAVQDERALMALAAYLLRERVPFVPVFEPDAPHDGALMSIGVKPARKETLKRHFAQLPLLK